RGKRKRNHNANTKILQRPDSMLARRPTTEILTGDKNTCARIAWLIKRKCGIKLAIRSVPPIVKQKFAEACTLDPFQKLLGNNVIGVDVRPLKRRDLPFVNSKWSHTYLPPE